MIAALFNVPRNPVDMSRFSFHNNDAHVLANRAILAKNSLLLQYYPIDPIPPQDFAGWLYNHQAWHNQVNAIIGVQGNDLSDVDPSKIDEWADWIQVHASEHVQWGDLLDYG